VEFRRYEMKDVYYWEKQTLDDSFRGIVSGSIDQLNIINDAYHFRGVSSLRLMDEKIMLKMMSFYMPRNHFLIDSYNEKILRLMEVGVVDHVIKTESYKKRNEKIDAFGPQVLDMDHLEVCFIVCMLPLVLAFAAFILELFCHKIKYKSAVKPKELKEIKKNSAKKKSFPEIKIVREFENNSSAVINLSQPKSSIETGLKASEN
jgi:hypothetical protein